MTEQARTATLDAGSNANEMLAQVIAGPETAARLGVPVGTVVEGRHVITPLDGSPSVATVVSPDEAEMIRQRITGEEV